MKSKTIRVLAASLMVGAVSVLASCGVTSSVWQGPIDGTVDTRGTSLTMWTGFGADISDQLAGLLKKFNDKYGINVTHETKGGYDNLNKSINLSASTMSYPNICIGYPDHFASYVDSDIQLRLDDFIAADANVPATRTGTAADSAAEGTFTEAAHVDMNDYYSYYLTENKNLEFKDDGTGYTLGLPYNKSTEVMVYNKTFFDNAIVKAAGIFVPETWNDLSVVGPKIISFVTPGFGHMIGADGHNYDSAAQISAAGTSLLMNLQSVSASNFIPLGYDSSANFFITGVRQWGGTYTHVDKATRQGFIDFDSAETRSFLTAMKTLSDAKIVGLPASFTGNTTSYCSSLYCNFQSVMNIGSSAGLGHYADGQFTSKNGMISGVAHIPFQTEANKIVISQGTNLAIMKKGSQAEQIASWKAIKYLSTEADGAFCAMTGYYPDCKSATASPEYQEFLTKTVDENGDPINDNTLNMQKAAVANATIYDATGSGWVKFVDPGFNGSSTIRTNVGTILNEVLIDGTNIDTVIATHVAALTDYVAK